MASTPNPFNWLLFFFNLIPVPPLDGGAILAGLLPDNQRNVIDFLNRYGFIILIGLLATGAFQILLRPAIWLASSCIHMAHSVAL